MEKDGMIINQYNNGTSVKFKNTRITVIKQTDFYILESLILSDIKDIDKPRATHAKYRDKVVSTSLKLTEKGAIALYLALRETLNNFKPY